MEYFKDVFGFEGYYQISNCGRILNLKRQKFVNPWKNKYGYLMFTVQKPGQRKHRTLHSLVLEAFMLDSRPADLVINHKNSIKTDNNLSNLEYCTVKENVHHCIRSGNFPDPHKRKKQFNDEQIRSIRKSKKRVVDLAREFNVSPSNIVGIRKKNYYKNVSDD